MIVLENVGNVSDLVIETSNEWALPVRFRVSWVVELAKDECVSAFHISGNTLSFRHCAVHALLSGCEHYLQSRRLV